MCDKTVNAAKDIYHKYEDSFRAESIEEDDSNHERSKSIDNNGSEGESEGWETVAEPSHPNIAIKSSSIWQKATLDEDDVVLHRNIPSAFFAHDHDPVQAQCRNESFPQFDLRHTWNAIHNNQNI